MKICITGGTGLLGKALIESVPDEMEITATYYPQRDIPEWTTSPFTYLDVRDEGSVCQYFKKERPEIIIHTASIGSVDFAEKNQEITWETNVVGTQHIANVCKSIRSKLIYISSNAVFDGENPPYSEDAPLNPINFYGKAKMEAEKIVQQQDNSFIIVRPILMYGWNDPQERQNPVTWLLDKLERSEKVHIVNDIYCNPLLSDDCARVIWTIINQGGEGIYHAAGSVRMNRYEFARETASVFGFQQELIKSVKNDFFAGIAPRPRDTSYTTTRIEKELGIKPLGVREGLYYMKKQMRWTS